jgi:hypothetical protein
LDIVTSQRNGGAPAVRVAEPFGVCLFHSIGSAPHACGTHTCALDHAAKHAAQRAYYRVFVSNGAANSPSNYDPALRPELGKDNGLGFNRSLQHLCSNTESEDKALWNDRESIG